MAAEVTEEEYDDWLDSLGESAISSYSAGWLFKRADSIAYQMGLNEYMDEMEEECRPTPPDFEPCYTEREIEDIYDEMLEDSLGTDWLADRYSISWLIKRADPTAYRVGFNDYEDMMTEDNEAETFAAHEPNCDCYGCEQKKWDARSYWEKQILLDNPEEYHRKSRALGWNETRKCRRCAKWGGEVYGAKVSQYNDGLRIYAYEDCGCWVYDHSIRNRRQKKWRKQKSRIAQEKYKEEREQQRLNREETERRRKSRKKWWQFWRAEDYRVEDEIDRTSGDFVFGVIYAAYNTKFVETGKQDLLFGQYLNESPIFDEVEMFTDRMAEVFTLQQLEAGLEKAIQVEEDSNGAGASPFFPAMFKGAIQIKRLNEGLEDSDLGQYAAEEGSKGRYIPTTEGYTKVAHWSVNPIYATKSNTSCRDGCGKRAKYKCLNCDYDWCEDHFGLLSVECPDEPMCYRCKNDWDKSWAEGFDTEYNFVMSDIGEADERVEEKLDDGWKLYGDPVVFEKQDFTVFGQGMTKDAESFSIDSKHPYHLPQRMEWWEEQTAGDCEVCEMDFSSWFVKDGGVLKQICSVCAEEFREQRKSTETFRADPLLQAIKDREKARKAGTVKLQGMPRTKGTKAEDVKVGDVLVWNQGGTSQVMSITPKGKQSLLWKTRTEDGREWDRTVRKNRLVVVARPNGWIAKKYADMKSESYPNIPCSRCGRDECKWWYHEGRLKCYFCKKGVGHKGEPLQHDSVRERVFHLSCYDKSLGRDRDFHSFRAEPQVEMSKPMSFYAGVVAGLAGFLALRSYFQNQE